MNAWKDLFELGRQRGGVIRASDGPSVGLSPSTISHRAAREGWPCPFGERTFVLPGLDPDDPLIRLRAARAHVSLEHAVAGGCSALWLHGVLLEPPPRPEILLPHDRRHRVHPEIRVVRTRRWIDEHITEVDDVPTAIVGRGLFDVALRFGRRRMRGLAIRARRLGVLRLEELAGVRGCFGAGRKECALVDKVLRDLLGDGSDSGAEWDWRTLLRKAGYDVWPRPFPYRCDDGVVVHLDVALPDYWVAVTHDGEAAHNQPRTFRTDRVQWSQVTRQWKVVWATEEDRADPSRVLEEVAWAVAHADPNRPPARPAT